MAEFLSIKGENPFRIRAYEKAADALEHIPQSVKELLKENKLANIPGIGKGMVEKIKIILQTGTLPAYEELKKEIPEGIRKLLSIPEVGPKTAKLLYEEAGIKNIEDLERAAREGKLRNLFGMGAKTEENILRGIRLYRTSKERILLGKALPLVEGVIEELKERAGASIKLISPAGSLRRGRETIGDIDILVASEDPEPIMESFTTLPLVREVLARGETKSSILTPGGLQMDLRVVSPSSYGAALQYFTGSKSHNIKLRERAIKRGLKINEYGVFTREGVKKGGEKEEDVYFSLDLVFIPPELREDRGEVELAEKGELPRLVELSQIRGDLHVHTKASDGAHSLEEMVEEAKRMGYEYLGICDHSVSLRVAGGLSVEEKLKQLAQIEKLNERLKNFRIITGAEVDIKADGTLDYPDEILKRLDMVVIAIHTGFKQDEKTMTARVLKAMENPWVKVLAHPTGRMIGERNPYSIDLDKVLEMAKERGIWLEVNAQPVRLDLSDVWIMETKKRGIKIVINTDAHRIEELGLIKYGVLTARRGWAEAEDVVNTLPLDKLLKELKLK